MGPLNRGYVLAALLGAVGGGFAVALATKAIPRIISRAMAEMMQTTMAQVAKDNCDPAEM
jgi:hypothetical protein